MSLTAPRDQGKEIEMYAFKVTVVTREAKGGPMTAHEYDVIEVSQTSAELLAKKTQGNGKLVVTTVARPVVIGSAKLMRSEPISAEKLEELVRGTPHYVVS
jgi:hypothetical protein